MPQFTLGEIMSQITKRVGQRSDLAASDVSFWVNAAYMEIADDVPHALLEQVAVSSTTSGGQRVTLPTDFGDPISLSIITKGNQSGTTLKRISISDVEGRTPRPLGEPNSYAIYRDWLELVPSPNSAYSLQIRYRSLATDMVTASTIPSLDTPWRKAVLYLAEAEIHALVDQPAEEALARQRYAAYAASRKNAEARRQLAESGMRSRVVYKDFRKPSRRSFDFD